MVWQLTYGIGNELAGDLYVDQLQTDPLRLLADAKSNLQKFDRVGFVQTFDADVAEVFRDIGAPGIPIRRSNFGQRALDRSDVSRAARSRLEKLTELDRDMYDHALGTYLAPAERRRRVKGIAAKFTGRFKHGTDR